LLLLIRIDHRIRTQTAFKKHANSGLAGVGLKGWQPTADTSREPGNLLASHTAAELPGSMLVLVARLAQLLERRVKPLGRGENDLARATRPAGCAYLDDDGAAVTFCAECVNREFGHDS
jgi:hypothetical protein